jgi:hypothetical protein
VYYVDLTLREGVNLQQAIQNAKEIDQKSKQAGFNQNALDQIARQCFSNVRFEVNAEEGLDLVEEFYMEENSEAEQQPTDSKTKIKSTLTQVECSVQAIQQGLQQSVSSVN